MAYGPELKLQQPLICSELLPFNSKAINSFKINKLKFILLRTGIITSGAKDLHRIVAITIDSFSNISYKLFMEAFKNYLQQDYLKRLSKNNRYSLRAYAQHLGINHATLSTIISGKRKITKSTVQKLAKALNLSPEETNRFLELELSNFSTEEISFYLLQNDVFSLMSEWYFDAILELSTISNINFEPKAIALVLNISIVQATLALETLVRLGLFQKSEEALYVITYKNSTNILDPDSTTSAQKNYQRSILNKSIAALENIDRKKRDHTSTTMAISQKDLPKAKELIQKFRHDLNAFMQRDSISFDEVYQLQVSFFPLTNNNPIKEFYEN